MTDPSITERWLPVVGYERLYEVSSLGRIKSLNRKKNNGKAWYVLPGRILKPKTDHGGYLVVNLCDNDTHKMRLIHRVVLEAFTGPCPKFMEGCHNDGNPKNNILNNLRWGTHKENGADMSKHGRSPRGITRKRAKLSIEEVKQIRTLCEISDITRLEISRMYNVSRGTICCVSSMRTWKWVE